MVRNYVIFGMFGSALNITDGRYVYMRAVRTPQEPIGEYTLMPTRLKGFFGRQQLQTAVLFPGSTFTNGIPTLRYSVLPPRADKLQRDLLFDLYEDPKQINPLESPLLIARFETAIAQQFRECDAPVQLYRRFGIPV